MKSANEKINILYNFLKNKYNFNRGDVFLAYTNGLHYNGLQIVVDNFKLWNKLLKKRYSDKELSEYLMEVIKKSLPDLKGEVIIIKKENNRLLGEKI